MKAKFVKLVVKTFPGVQGVRKSINELTEEPMVTLVFKDGNVQHLTVEQYIERLYAHVK